MSSITRRVSVTSKYTLKEGHYLLMLTLFSGLLFFMGWPVNPFPFLLFFAFIPILAIEHYLAVEKPKKAGKKFFICVYLAFLIWNLGSTWWVYFSTAIGAVFMLLANSFLMTLPMLLFRFTKAKAGIRWGYFSFVLYWLAFEYIHITWDLSWPWLTLGNGLSIFPQWIQWYEYTGIFGGSLWIILINLALFFAIFKSSWITKKIVPVRSIIYISLLIVVPIAISYIIYFNYEERGTDTEVVVLQPNIDPFTEKFIGTENFIPFEQQLERFFKLSEEKITPNTSFVVWPETALDAQVLESQYQNYDIMQKVISFRKNNPHISLITGLTTTNIFPDKKSAPPSARYHAESNIYYGVYNTALFLNDNEEHEFYHKSKLVPGVEIMPYPQVFGFIADLLFNLGGTSGGFGRQEDRTVFFNSQNIGIAPSICYESIYGEFMARFVMNGANFIFIITNDGWWGDSPGYKQHLQYATMRAIETRRSIARSANTGISAFINQRGDILERTAYWEQDAIRGNIKSNDKITFYVQYGDYIGRTATWLSVFVFLSAMVKRKFKK
ncbi:MAG: apolipoprotein N-acyltransferase [Bacteroidota bacterium]|nr:apolipoprotein N-acyltransferase [Bacteroidota bacterium]